MSRAAGLPRELRDGIEGLNRDQRISLMVGELDSERRGMGPLNGLSWPDARERRERAVEMTARDMAGEVAVEHTIIESYPEQIRDQRALLSLFPKGGPELTEQPNAGQYQLVVYPGIWRQVATRDRSDVSDRITSWVRDNLASVPWPHRPGSPTYTSEQVSGIVPKRTIALALSRWTDSINLVGPGARVVRVTFWRPKDIQVGRTQRVQRALEEKVPKLLNAAQESARSILVLEDRDLSMSSPAHVAHALRQASATAPLPDVIYLFNTTAGDPLVMLMYEDGSWYDDGAWNWITFPPDLAGTFNAAF